jgi:hypothetical protein
MQNGFSDNPMPYPPKDDDLQDKDETTNALKRDLKPQR